MIIRGCSRGKGQGVFAQSVCVCVDTYVCVVCVCAGKRGMRSERERREGERSAVKDDRNQDKRKEGEESGVDALGWSLTIIKHSSAA